MLKLYSAQSEVTNAGFHLGGLADKLGSAIGASRTAVDSGYAPNDRKASSASEKEYPSLLILRIRLPTLDTHLAEPGFGRDWYLAQQ